MGWSSRVAFVRRSDSGEPLKMVVTRRDLDKAADNVFFFPHGFISIIRRHRRPAAGHMPAASVITIARADHAETRTKRLWNPRRARTSYEEEEEDENEGFRFVRFYVYVVRFAFTRSLFSNRSSGVHYGGGCRISLFLFRVIFFARATYTPVRIRIPINIHIERIYIYIYI